MTGNSCGRPHIAVVGGGIAGLYAAWRLAGPDHFTVTVFEAGDRWGGRIETVDMAGFDAEFGPMRFEPGIQPLLDRLRASLGLDYKSFPKTSSQLLSGALRRYHFRPDEIRDGDALSTLEMLELGVLRLFQESHSQLQQLDASMIPSGRVGPSADGVWTTVVQPWIDGFSDDGSPSYNDLRKTAQLHGRPLFAQGFWNAISEVLSPDAVRYIRDEGTFYHLIPDNPNAVEWGVFWLRLFRTAAANLKGITGGVSKLVSCLVDTIANEQSEHVHLRLAQEVIGLEPAADPSAVRLLVRDRRRNETYMAEADHVILALPLTPLRQLSTFFPDRVKDDLQAAFGFPLLKAFLVTRDPWWGPGTAPQTGAGVVPTRELHYWRTRDRPQADGLDGKIGLMMLYTDHPATVYWHNYVVGPVHDRAELNGSDEFLTALVRSLLVDAKREAHRQLDQALADAQRDESGAADTNNLWGAAALEIREITRKQLIGWRRKLRLPAESQLEDVLDALRNPDSLPSSSRKEVETIRVAVAQLLDKLVKTKKLTDRQSAILLDAATTEERIAKEKTKIVCFGIRDWNRAPFYAGCHSWAAGGRSWEVLARIRSFGLVGRSSFRERANIHICGEALSDYQGFIEGALRTARAALLTIPGYEE